MKILSFVFLLVASGVSAHSLEDAKAARLASAKTACIQQRNGTPKDLEAAQKELKSWGRFELKDSCSVSDVTIYLISRRIAEANVCGVVGEMVTNPDGVALWSGREKCKTDTTAAIMRMMRQMRADLSGGKRATEKTAASKKSAHGKSVSPKPSAKP